MNKAQGALEEINRLTDLIITQVANLSELHLHWKPSEKIWSVMEILCHVDEIVPYWLHELQRVIESPGIEWGRNHLDEGRLVAVACSKQRDLEDILNSLNHNKQTAHNVLNSIRDEDLMLEAPSRNPRFGTKPMMFIVSHLLVDHLQSHLNQIQRNLQQYEAANHHI